jgi:hypothetical protein
MSHGQGTIEYLIILAIVVVVSLVVVVLVSNFSTSSNVSQSSDKLTDLVGGGGISIVESVSDFEDTGFLSLQNNSGGSLTLKSISTSEGEKEYDFPWGSGNKELFDISGLCNCETGQETKTCTFTVNIITSNGLEKKHSQKITLQCSENPIPNKTPLLPIHCYNSNDNPIQICSLQDLNRIREKLDGNYILLKDIDAIDTKTWNTGKGFTPIGNQLNSFTGIFDGQGHIIFNLFITETPVDLGNTPFGLFGYVSEGQIKNVGLEDLNMVPVGYYAVGGLVGQLNSGNVSNCYVKGMINAPNSYYVGGIIGYNIFGIIQDSYSDATLIGENLVGGIVGYNQIATVQNCYSKGQIEASFF